MELVISFQETELIRQLREQAEQLNVSLDALVLDLIRLGLTVSQNQSELQTFHDLDDLAGTWSAQEVESFNRTLADFEQVDEGLWQICS